LDSLEPMLRRVGFENIQINLKEESKEFIKEWMPGTGCENYVVSAGITANKPKSVPQSVPQKSGIPELLKLAFAMGFGSVISFFLQQFMQKISSRK